MEEVDIKRNMRIAIKQGDITGVKALIAHDPAIIGMITPFGGWLHVAASLGKLEIAEFLIGAGADINMRAGVPNAAPIDHAASAGHIRIVAYLLSCGAELDVSAPDRNPLFAAIYGGHIEIVRLLISAGINIGVKYTGDSMINMDALAFARERGQMDIAALLADA